MKDSVRTLLRVGVAGVWIYHGLYNKLLLGEPRHLLIVQSVPGLAGSVGEIALHVIGVAEVLLGAWVLSGCRPIVCAAVQTAALLSMNILELTWARDHLYWPATLLPANLALLGCAWLSVDPARFYRLRRHPLAVRAHFKDCLVLTYAVPADRLGRLLPPGLEVDAYDGWGFIAIAVVQTTGLRPVGAPAALGQDFFLTGYRIFTRFRTPAGKTLRGLRILRSDTDKRRMMLGGSLLTHYNYRHCNVTSRRERDRWEVAIRTPDGRADLHVIADLGGLADAPLPPRTVFRTAQDARRFAGPLPWTFDYEPQTHSIIAIKGVRHSWKPRRVPVTVSRNSFMDQAPLKQMRPRLVSAFHVSDIDYHWERGIVHPLRSET